MEISLKGVRFSFNELQRRMPKMTHATLSVQLKSLVEKGLVERKQYDAIPPKVEYSLPEIGKKFHLSSSNRESGNGRDDI